ncbi:MULTISPECIES: hypothetical protein [Bacillaceae]|uniref:FixH family protein n=1 Tax=Evansella alkalicola TaxID=745819 RepID=A0ABS6JQS1_9BACI|nr:MULTISPECIES: hypothetical protein [Bacillaceae]MBU9720828.1 FixH family protein [Bacillus alkalicola]
MKTESSAKTVNYKKHLRIVITLFCLSIVAMLYMLPMDTVVEEEGDLSWTIQWAAKDYPIRTENQTTIQVIVMEDPYTWLEGADVKGEFHAGTAKAEVELVHVDGGLYEGRTTFSQPGNWTGVVTVKEGDRKNSQEVNIMVHG